MNQTIGQELAGACAVPDENLLMYLHGGLPPMARFRTGRHLRRCPACRRRLALFTTTSQALADTLRGDALPRWSPPRLPSPGLLPTATLPVLFLCFALLTLTASVWMTTARYAPGGLPGICQPAATQPVAVEDPESLEGCKGTMAITPATQSAPSPGRLTALNPQAIHPGVHRGLPIKPTTN